MSKHNRDRRLAAAQQKGEAAGKLTLAEPAKKRVRRRAPYHDARLKNIWDMAYRQTLGSTPISEEKDIECKP